MEHSEYVDNVRERSGHLCLEKRSMCRSEAFNIRRPELQDIEEKLKVNAFIMK